MEDNKDTQVVENQNAEKSEVKTYTEVDIQNSFNAGVKKANSEWQKDAKYKEFIEWKKGNQNDSEKISQLEKDNTGLNAEIKTLKAQLEIAGSNVKKEFAKFVTSEVLGLTNETTDIKTALENFKKDNPQYFGDTIIKKVQTSPNLGGGTTKAQTTNDVMNSLLRNRGKN